MSNTLQGQTNAYGRSYDLNFDRQMPNYHERLNANAAKDPLHFIVRKAANDQSGEAVELKSFSALAIKVTGFMAMIALLFYFAASWYGDKVSKAGHTTQTNLKELSIGTQDFAIPLNMMRFNAQRQAGILERADLYAHYPSMSGYAQSLAHEFDSLQNDAPIIFMSLGKQIMRADMFGRVDSVYNKFLNYETSTKEFGLSKVSFANNSPYVAEDLYYTSTSVADGVTGYAVRCISETQQGASPICMRDVNIGNKINVSYRFHKSLLVEWQVVERSIINKINTLMLN